jgi:hypothetical protein
MFTESSDLELERELEPFVEQAKAKAKAKAKEEAKALIAAKVAARDKLLNSDNEVRARPLLVQVLLASALSVVGGLALASLVASPALALWWGEMGCSRNHLICRMQGLDNSYSCTEDFVYIG